MTSRMYGALWAHGARTDRAWAALQAAQIAELRRRGRYVTVHPATVREVPAYVNDGRWVLDCACRNGPIVDRTFGTARCLECGAVYTRGQIALPRNADQIEATLLRLYPHDTTLQDWRPGQRLHELAGRHHSWTTPRTWTTGELVTAAIMNTHVRDNLNESAPAKQTSAYDFIVGGSAANSLQRIAAVDGQAPKYTTAGGWAMAVPGQVQLLKANSGTSTAASLTAVDTYAMASTLTAKDRLLVILHGFSETQGTAEGKLENSTDGVSLGGWSFALAAGDHVFLLYWVHQQQTGATTVMSFREGNIAGNVGNGVTSATFTTNWTGAWTLANYHGAVTSGGTFRWTWWVGVIRGQ